MPGFSGDGSSASTSGAVVRRRPTGGSIAERDGAPLLANARVLRGAVVSRPVEAWGVPRGRSLILRGGCRRHRGRPITALARPRRTPVRVRTVASRDGARPHDSRGRRADQDRRAGGEDPSIDERVVWHVRRAHPVPTPPRCRARAAAASRRCATRRRHVPRALPTARSARANSRLASRSATRSATFSQVLFRTRAVGGGAYLGVRHGRRVAAAYIRIGRPRASAMPSGGLCRPTPTIGESSGAATPPRRDPGG